MLFIPCLTILVFALGCEAGVSEAPQALAESEGLRFRVTATSGTKAVTASPLSRDEVLSVSTSGSTLNLQLASGKTVGYSDVKAFSS